MTTADPADNTTAVPTGARTGARTGAPTCGSACVQHYNVTTAGVGFTIAAALLPGAGDVNVTLGNAAGIELRVPSAVLAQAAVTDELAVAACLTVLSAPFPETRAASQQVSVGVVGEDALSGVWADLSGVLLAEPAYLTLLPQKEDGVRCAIWDNSQGAWSSAGVEEVIHDGSVLMCRTNYTGVFTALYVETMTTTASPNDTEDDDRNGTLCEHTLVLTGDALRHAVQDGEWPFGLPGLLFLVLLLVTLASLVLACRVDARRARRHQVDSKQLLVGRGAAGDRHPGCMAYLCEQLAGLADPAWASYSLTYHALAYQEQVAVGTVRAIAERSRRRADCSGASATTPIYSVAAWVAVDHLAKGGETPLITSKRAVSVCDAFWCSSLCQRLWVVFLALNPLLRWRRYSVFVQSQPRLLVVAGEVFGSLVAIVLCLGDECESSVHLQEDIGVGVLCAVLSVLALGPIQLVLLFCRPARWQPREPGSEELHSNCSACSRPLEAAIKLVLIFYLFCCALYVLIFVANASLTIRSRVAISGASGVFGIFGLFPWIKAVLLLLAAALHQHRYHGALDKVRGRLQRFNESDTDEWTSVAVAPSSVRPVEPAGGGTRGQLGDEVTVESEELPEEELHDRLEAAAAHARNASAALRATAGAGLYAKATSAQVSGQCSPGQIERFMAVVERQWGLKDRTLAQELCENLRQPKGGRAPGLPAEAELAGAFAGLPADVAFLSPRALAEVCRCVQEKYGSRPLNAELQGHLLSICCWVVYTMQDVDIDRLFGFPDCPVLPPGMEEPALRDAVYNEYRARIKGGRCPQMFSAANWAARVCFDKGGDVSTEAGRDALAGVQTWVKWLCFLGASARDLEEPVTVTRGLCGLPEQLVDDFRCTRAGDCIFWAAPSSTTDDARISDSYCNQQEPKERNVLFTISGVTRAFPMFELSQYPDEREWLLPPFCNLRVDRVVDGAPVQVECTFVGCMMSGPLCEKVVRDFKQASRDLGRVLSTMEEELSAQKKQLEQTRRRGLVCTRAVFRAGLLLLARRPPGGGASPLEHLLRDFRARARPPPRGAPPRPSALPQAAATARAGGVAASLESAVGASLGAKSSAAEVSGGCSRQQVDSFMELVQRQWEQKDLTLLQELCGSLRQPKAARGMLGRQAGSTGAAPVEAEAVTPRTLAEVCSCVREKYARKPLNEQLQGHLLSTCCWALCTMQDGDIDRLFGFLDCPTLPPGMKEPALRDAAYNEYRARCKGDRCPHMFSVANWAARVCFDKGGDVSTEAGRDALAGLQKWIKWLCFLGASARDLEEPVTVTRGLCGLPEQLVDDLRRKQAGDCIFWAAPSSTTDDVRISDDYCSQQTPRERNVLFTISGVTQAFPMFELSQYPQEREWLLPPFCELWVNRVFDGAPLRVECTFVGCMLPAALRERAVRDLEKASQDLCAALDTEEEEELSALGRRLAEARRRSVQEAPPLPVRRAQPRPLHARDLVGGPPAAGQGAAEGARERPEELARTWRPASQEDQHQGEPELDEDLESEPEAEEPMEVRLSASGPPMHVYRPTSASRVRHSRRSGS